MSPCPICQHDKHEAIDADITRGMPSHRLTFKYRIDKADLIAHQAHLQVVASAADEQSQQNSLVPVLESLGEAMALGSLRLDNFERLLGVIMDRLEQALGPTAELHAVDGHDAEKQFQAAWQQLHGDQIRQQRMVRWLNEQLQRDDMGLQ